ncbi:hypothetical protein CBR64_07795 [Cellulosimicrobium cellulans]|uniref:DNA (cytosine-5-)-methyltransferase n=1 Tax=Cellulosimicrobium cellulans TaxID=1710 RepID=A0A1Y0HW70_CELCE|nr:DNA cytosine methyltransferase [Cellulosimicrobium cellulans]ARU51403.1 hypothetical protein CBR64_07795 [Cellulosimicrobium cellulans]
MNPDARRVPPITVLDLFSGCGGLTEGFHQYQPKGHARPAFHTVGAVEWDESAAATYALNFGGTAARRRGLEPPVIVCSDIREWTPPWGPGEVDVVVGGPPCQGFSGLNREKVRAERNQLWQEFIKVVVALQPKVFVIENVDRFLRSVEFQDLKQRIGGADLTNYELVDPLAANDGPKGWERERHYLLNAADFGAPQARRRAIVIGRRIDVDLDGELLRYPEPTHSKDGTDGKRRWLSIDSLFRRTAGLPLRSDLPDRGPRPIPGVEGMYRGPFSSRELHIGRNPEPLSLARYRAIPAGGNRKDLRGRYACRFDGGEEIIIERSGEYRDASGHLVVDGSYRIVAAGSATLVPLTVRLLEKADPAAHGSSGRSKSERFLVAVRTGGSERKAELEYLSTPSWDAHDTGSGDVMGRARMDAPSVTIRTEFFKPEKGRYLHPTEDRPITHLEAARLQGFPASFKWCGSRLDIAKQIGNAVPIPLGRKIAESIYRYLDQAGTRTSA